MTDVPGPDPRPTGDAAASGDRPLVSIVIPCFDGERHLAAAIASALAQTGQPVEVVVVDDGSTDGSRAVADGFGERVRVVATARGGVARARNLGLSVSRGAFVHFLDADDVLPAGAVAEKMRLFELHPDADAVWSRVWVPFDPDFGADVAVPRTFAELLSRGWLPRATGLGERLGVPAPASTPVLYRRALLERSGGFDPAVPLQENIELPLRLYLGGARFVGTQTIGLVYRNDRRAPRLTDRETWTSPELWGAVDALARTVEAGGALASSLGDEIAAWCVDAAGTCVRHGDLALADRWFALGERIRPGVTPSRPALRPLTAWLGRARQGRIAYRLARLAGRLGLRPRPRRR